MLETNPLSLKACYSKAWKAFAKWWIPICLLASFLMVFQLGPRQLAKAESHAMGQSVAKIKAAFDEGDFERLEELAIELNETARVYAKKLAILMLYAIPFVAILSILLLRTSIMAVKGQRTRYPPGRIIAIALVNLLIAIVKVALMLLLLPFGLFIYVKLFFVSLLMLEEGNSPAEAIEGSWSMTQGNFWPLLGMVAINGTLQFAMAPTVVGLIPSSGFANTARAAAFMALRNDGSTNSSVPHRK